MQHKPYDHNEGWWDRVGRHVSKWIMDDLAHMPCVCENTTEARGGPYWDQQYRKPNGNLLTTDVECTAHYWWLRAQSHHENDLGPFCQHIWARKLQADHLAQLFILLDQAILQGVGFGWMCTRTKVGLCPTKLRVNSNYGREEESYVVPDHQGRYFHLINRKWQWWHPRTQTPRVDHTKSSPQPPKPEAEPE